MIDPGGEKYYYDKEAAERAILFIEHFCSHIKGDAKNIGKPFKLEDWQKNDIIRPLFGVKRKDTGKRRYKTCYVEIAAKNGKTPLAAAIMLYALTSLQPEGGANVYCVATSTKQADEAFGWAKKMARRNETLSSMLDLKQHAILYDEKGSSLKILPNNESTCDGLNASFILVDELHRHKTPGMFELMQKSLAAHSEGILLAITTAGNDRETVCYYEHEKALGVLNGTLEDDSYLPVIYAADPNTDIYDDEQAKKAIYDANPNLDVSVSFDWLWSRILEARQQPYKENSIKRYHLNIWTEQATRWLPLDLWDSNDKTFTEEELLGKPCFLNLDWSASQDMGALVAVFNNRFGGYDILPTFFVPGESLIRKEEQDKVSYSAWHKQGYLEHHQSVTLDERKIIEHVKDYASKFSVQRIAYDTSFLSTRTIQELEDAGFECFPHGKGFIDFNAPSRELYRALLEKQIRHNDHPVLRWNASNVEVIEGNHGDIRPVRPKQNSRHKKVDGIVCAIMGITHAMRHKEKERKGYRRAVFV